MLRDEAVTRIQDGLGFRTDLSDKIILRMIEAQRELEKGKTLPRFLLVEDATLTLANAARTVELPTGFIRELYDEPIRYTPVNTRSTRFMAKQSLREIIRVYNDTDVENAIVVTALTEPPRFYMIRKSVVDFYVVATQSYAFTWSYYASGASLESNVENAWLANASEWLIGEAGLRMAADLRDAEAAALFMSMATKARASVLAQHVAEEEAGGPRGIGESE